MYQYNTQKRYLYYDRVIEIYKETGYSARKIEKLGLVPVSRHAIQDWINNFVSENGRVSPNNTVMLKAQAKNVPQPTVEDVQELKQRIKELEEQLLHAEIKAEFYNEMINVAEAKFKIPIRKKAGAKQ